MKSANILSCEPSDLGAKADGANLVYGGTSISTLTYPSFAMEPAAPDHEPMVDGVSVSNANGHYSAGSFQDARAASTVSLRERPCSAHAGNRHCSQHHDYEQYLHVFS